MKPALRFLVKTALFGATFVGGILAIGSIKPNLEPSDYTAVIADKHARLARTPPPRILLGGGSNLAFGVDSAAMEQALHLPVVNMGIHAGLGLRFILREMEDVMRPQDIVVLSIEYCLPLTIPGQYALLRTASDAYPPARAYYDRDVGEEIGLRMEHLRASIRSLLSRPVSPDPVYSRAAFNERGDNIVHLTAPSPPDLRDRARLAAGRWEGIAALNEFAELARRRNVRVFFIYPSYAETEYEKNRDVISALDRDLREALHVELLGTPRDAVYPDNEFYDTIFHLDSRGRQQHTRDIVRLLADKTGLVSLGSD